MFDRVNFEKVHTKKVKINFINSKGCTSVYLNIEYLLLSS